MPDFLQFALSLNGPDPGAALAATEIARALAEEELAWVHLSATDPASAAWIEENLSYLPAPVREALTAEATRPRVSPQGDGAMVILRGVNTNPGADPEDMVSVRLWIDPARIVSLSRRPLAAVAELQASIAAGEGPRDAGGFLADLLACLNAGIVARVDRLDEKAEIIEDGALAGDDPGGLRHSVTDVRRELAVLRRFLRPQRDAAATLTDGRLAWTGGDTRHLLVEVHDVLTRTVEDLDELTERMAVARDEIASALSDRLNSNLFRLSLVSAIFLPLGFLTGLMGINLGGMPGASSDSAFWIFCAGLGVVLALLLVVLWWFRKPRRG
ncbi:zinc transporter ZntB [Seohaeicola saemankumensis]|nr:zinc transporter ZntB [Seohaeicola saemankumensis]MCA0873794.1 zinc transporter ZntB [Seohaeicola saemankumensis]